MFIHECVAYTRLIVEVKPCNDHHSIGFVFKDTNVSLTATEEQLKEVAAAITDYFEKRDKAEFDKSIDVIEELVDRING
jgi:hypothetical protein